MIAELLASAPIGALLAYGLLEARRSRLVGAAIAALATTTLALVWLPSAAGDVAAAAGFAGTAELLGTCSLALSGLVLLNVHLKLRRQLQVITHLARELALAEADREADAAARVGGDAGERGGQDRGRDEIGSIVRLKPLARHAIPADDLRGSRDGAAARREVPATAAGADEDATVESDAHQPAAQGTRR